MTDDQTSGQGVRGVTSQQLHDLFQESMHWTPRQMWDFQALQLEQLVRHAWTHVPFYTDRLRCLIRPDGSVDLSRWSEVPIVKRKDLQQQRVLMLSPHLPPGHGRAMVGRTSGSSGKPVAVDFSELSSLVSSMAWERASRLHDIPFEKGIAEFQALLPDGRPMTGSTYPLARGPANPPKFLLNRKLPAPEKLQALAETKAAVLVDVPNHAEVLARENLRQGSPHRLRAFVGIGMAVSPLQEELISRSFGAHVFSPYSSTEGGMLGFQCATQRSNFHINSELALLEIVDADDKPVRPGEAGRVIITPLFNAAQPLIRYEQGDIVVRGSSCSCGLTLPVLSKIQGRVDDMFHLPTGAASFANINETMIQKRLQAEAVQFAQVAMDHVIVRYVAPVEADGDTRQLLAAHIRELLNYPAMQISFARLSEIPVNDSGKHQRIRREFDL